MEQLSAGGNGNAGSRPRLSRGALAWSFVETGRTSYSVIVSIYVFIPYLASVLAADPVRGQQFVADVNLWAGIAAALIAPLLGATIDHLGRRKTLLVSLSLATVPASAMLWFAALGQLSLMHIGLLLAMVTLLFSLCEVVQNSLLVHAAQPWERAYASGLAYTFGNSASLLLMLFMLWAFVLPGSVDAIWLPDRPLLGLDAASHEPERLAGPLSGLIILISTIPLILYTRDAPPSSLSVPQALRSGAADLRGMIAVLRAAPDARRFLIARMIFADALGGIILFTGVFAAGVFGWGARELMIEGLICSLFAAAGGLLAGTLDTRLGPKRSILIALTGFLICVIGEIGVAKDRIFFFFSYDPAINGRPWTMPLFNSWPEVTFILCDMLISVFLISALASSRTMMAELAPPGRSAIFFGLFALSGRATAWLCPLLVGLATAASGSQQIGFIPIAALAVVGMVLLFQVRTPPRETAPERTE